jgi:hypothetical protein
MLRSLIHFELILVQDGRQGSSFSLLDVDIQFSQQHLLKRLSFRHGVLGSFAEDQLAIDAWAYAWLSYSDSLVFLSVFVPVPCCFYCYGPVVWFELGHCDASSIGHFQPCFMQLTLTLTSVLRELH